MKILKYEFNNKLLGGVTLLKVTLSVTLNNVISVTLNNVTPLNIFLIECEF